MFSERFNAEVAKILENSKGKEYINEEDIILRFLKYDASADELKDVLKFFEDKGFKIKYQKDIAVDVEDFSKIVSEVSVDDPVKMYLKDIGKVPLLQQDEEVELAKRMAEGDSYARAKLSEANLRLVVSIAK